MRGREGAQSMVDWTGRLAAVVLIVVVVVVAAVVSPPGRIAGIGLLAGG